MSESHKIVSLTFSALWSNGGGGGVGERGDDFVRMRPPCTIVALCGCVLAHRLHNHFQMDCSPALGHSLGVGDPCFTIYFTDISKKYEIYVHVHSLMSTTYFYKQYLASNFLSLNMNHRTFCFPNCHSPCPTIHLGLLFCLPKLFSYLCISIFVLIFSLSYA